LTAITDIGNESDELCFAMPGVYIDGNTVNSNADRFINRVARTISHELGHSFGLGHFETDTDGNVTDALTHHIMGDSTVGPDFAFDFNFQDIAYDGDIFSFANSTSQNFPELNTETQNAHQILSRTDVLGPAQRTWMAVLKPGELTIRGDNNANVISISESGDDWIVQLNTMYAAQIFGNPTYLLLQTTTVVDATNPNINSLNPFDAGLTRANVFGLGGNDTISMAAQKTAQLVAHGGSGDDTITGGDGADTLHGNNGKDKLYGGGNGDCLLGGAGVDELFGQGGDDHLFGGDMYFDDLVVDRLNGGAGRDLFYQHVFSGWNPAVQDNAEDWNLTEDWLIYYI
jgi:Ca2+-binding RTX toxin-like protein